MRYMRTTGRRCSLEVNVMVRSSQCPEDHDGHARDHQTRRRLLEEPPVPGDDYDVRQVLENGHLRAPK